MEMVIPILALVVSVLSLIFCAYTFAMYFLHRKKFAKLEQLPEKVEQMEQEIKALKAQLAPEKKPEPPKEKPAFTEEKVDRLGGIEALRAIWQDFIDDYNSLASSMEVPKAAEACETFVSAEKLDLLVCIDSKRQENGAPTPKFAPVQSVAASNYWAWAVPESDTFILVPNPLHPYTADLHSEGGMKETFASNYESGEYKNIQVKFPAKFFKDNGEWKIEQPGVIKLK